MLRDREPTLRRDLARRVAELRARGASEIRVLTNGRLLLYPALVDRLTRAGARSFVVKLFGLDAAEHDAWTGAPGSFEQAVAGVRAARAAGAEALVTFPRATRGDGGEREREALARALSSRAPVEMPEPEVQSHPSEFRYDVVRLREGVTAPYWVNSFFPMVHVHTGPFCNIRCTYCNVHGGDDQRLFELSFMQRVIDDAAQRILGAPETVGTPTVDFIGGEPTMHPQLPAAIRHARSRGFPQVYVCTNGSRLTEPGYLDSLIEAGLTGVRFSFHEHRAEAARRLAGIGPRGEHYPETARMLLGRTDLQVHLYRIVLSSSVDALPDYVRWLHEHNRTGAPLDLTFGMPSMRGRLFENRELYVPLDGLREHLRASFAVARSLGVDPAIHHAPACLLPEEAHRAACLHIDMLRFDALRGTEESTNYEGDARHGRACERCSARERGCQGLPSAYWEADPEAAERWLHPVDAVSGASGAGR